MPAFGVYASGATGRMSAATGYVRSLTSGSVSEYAEVLRIEAGCGMQPGRAFVSFRNRDASRQTSQITLLEDGALSPKFLKYWSRIEIQTRGSTVFIGNLVVRNENIGGQSIVLEYVDDSIFLHKLFLRGAFVYDQNTSTIKFLTRYDPHPNPNGYANCCKASGSITGFSTTGITGTFYVFTQLAEQKTQGSSDYRNIGNEGAAEGEAIFWTPERWASYCRLAAMVAASASPYLGNYACLDSNKVDFPALEFSGSDEQLKKRIMGENYRGKSIMLGLMAGLDATGEYGLRVTPNSSGKSTIATYAKSATQAADKRTIALQRSGAVGDLKTLFAGSVRTDATEFHSGVLVESMPPRIEAQFQYTQADNVASISGDGSDHLFPAWTRDEEYFFMQIIVEGIRADGSRIKLTKSDGTTVDLTVNSEAALQLARQAYPKVFRAFQLRGSNLQTILDGVSNKFSSYPSLLGFKAILDTQLQPYFEDGTTTGAQVGRGKIRLPVRIQITDKKASDTTGQYVEVPFNNGLRVTDDGLIWFDGLTDDINSNFNVYAGSLKNCTDATDVTHSTYPKLRRIKLNATIEHDFRMFDYANLGAGGDPNEVIDQIDETVIPWTTGGADILQRLVHNPEGFREEHQKNSYPCDPAAFPVANDDGSGLASLSVPVNKILHTDKYNADNNQIGDYAKRKLRERSRIRKTFSVELPGIQLGWMPGDFIEKVVLQPSGGEHKINAACDKVVHQFEEPQKTIIVGDGGTV